MGKASSGDVLFLVAMTVILVVLCILIFVFPGDPDDRDQR